VNFKQGRDHKICPLLSHFQNDGATVECGTPDPVSSSVLLELKQVEEKERGRDRGGCSLKGMFVVGLTGVLEVGGGAHSGLHQL